MTGIPYIIDLFTNVLKKSNAIQGRFFVLPKRGAELNSDDMEQVIKDTFEKRPDQRFPIAGMMPPTSEGPFIGSKSGWQKYKVDLYFLTQAYNTGANVTADRNPNTNTSMHTIPQDWHDMNRAAVMFIRMLKDVVDARELHSAAFRVGSNAQYIDTVTFASVKRLNGVHLQFWVECWIGCVTEDYALNSVLSIQVPLLDSHPEHKM